MKNRKLLFSFTLVFLNVGFSPQIFGMEKQDGDDMYKRGLVRYNAYKTDCDLKHLAAAKSCLKEPALLDHPDAQCLLGIIYYGVYGVMEDVELAELWLRRKNVADWKQGKPWLEKSAEHNHPIAQYLLGFIYYHGLGVERNWDLAKSWLSKPATLGNTLAQEILEKIKLGPPARQDEFKTQPTTNLTLLQKANQRSTSKDTEGPYKTGMEYYTAGDFKSAKNHLEESAAQNHPGAQSMLGVMNYYGLGVPQNEERAIKYYRQAAKQKHPLAIDNLEAIKNIKQFRSQNSFLPSFGKEKGP